MEILALLLVLFVIPVYSSNHRWYEKQGAPDSADYRSNLLEETCWYPPSWDLTQTCTNYSGILEDHFHSFPSLDVMTDIPESRPVITFEDLLPLITNSLEAFATLENPKVVARVTTDDILEQILKAREKCPTSVYVKIFFHAFNNILEGALLTEPNKLTEELRHILKETAAEKFYITNLVDDIVKVIHRDFQNLFVELAETFTYAPFYGLSDLAKDLKTGFVANNVTEVILAHILANEQWVQCYTLEDLGELHDDNIEDFQDDRTEMLYDIEDLWEHLEDTDPFFHRWDLTEEIQSDVNNAAEDFINWAWSSFDEFFETLVHSPTLICDTLSPYLTVDEFEDLQTTLYDIGYSCAEVTPMSPDEELEQDLLLENHTELLYDVEDLFEYLQNKEPFFHHWDFLEETEWNINTTVVDVIKVVMSSSSEFFDDGFVPFPGLICDVFSPYLMSEEFEQLETILDEKGYSCSEQGITMSPEEEILQEVKSLERLVWSISSMNMPRELKDWILSLLSQEIADRKTALGTPTSMFHIR